jgi:GT2 family glycosyltransferase
MRKELQAAGVPGPRVTLCVLVYGDYEWLARRVLDSIQHHCARIEYQLVVGANATSRQTLALLRDRARTGQIDRLLTSRENLGKCPMMQRMFEGLQTDLMWWFDDDSYLTQTGAFHAWLDHVKSSPPNIVQWGQEAVCWEPQDFTTLEDARGFVRSAAWYRGLPPPDWRPGGKGEFDLHGQGLGDGRWRFILGGCWLMRAGALQTLEWPDRRLVRLGDDVFLGEAIRQRGWSIANIGTPGVCLNTEPRRGA